MACYEVAGSRNYGKITACWARYPLSLVAWDLDRGCGLILWPRRSLDAEMLFVGRQLALYRHRGVKPRRVDAATRVTLAFSRWFNWRTTWLCRVRLEHKGHVKGTALRLHRLSAGKAGSRCHERGQPCRYEHNEPCPSCNARICS